MNIRKQSNDEYFNKLHKLHKKYGKLTLVEIYDLIDLKEQQNKQLLKALIYVHKRYENVIFTKGFTAPFKNPLHPEVEDSLYYEKVTSIIESIMGEKIGEVIKNSKSITKQSEGK